MRTSAFRWRAGRLPSGTREARRWRASGSCEEPTSGFEPLTPSLRGKSRRRTALLRVTRIARGLGPHSRSDASASRSTTPDAHAGCTREALSSAEACNQCGGTFVLAPSDYGLAPLLVCEQCDREIPAGAMAHATTAQKRAEHASAQTIDRKQGER